MSNILPTVQIDGMYEFGGWKCGSAEIKFASSTAIGYTQFRIAESDFLRQGVLEAKQIKEKSEHGHAEEICKLRNRITEHMSGLDERFITTGYSNRSSLVGFEAIRKKYDHLTNSLNGTSNAGK